MAVDLVTEHVAEVGPPRSKRRRLGWDVPDPVLLAEAARLQFLIATKLLQAYPSVLPTQTTDEDRGSSVQDGHSDVETADEHGNAPWHEDDTDGHFNFEVGEDLTSRYKILKKMGEGTFGRVLECWDKDKQDVVAVKVVRSVDSYREAAMIEIDVLHTLAKKDRMGARGDARTYFWHERKLDWPDRHTSKESIRAVHHVPRLRDLVEKYVDEPVGSFVDLLGQMFSYNPSDRPAAKEALRHQFFQVS